MLFVLHARREMSWGMPERRGVDVHGDSAFLCKWLGMWFGICKIDFLVSRGAETWRKPFVLVWPVVLFILIIKKVNKYFCQLCFNSWINTLV